ncbi:MAG: radical SAM protein [Eubacteriales bacterium]|nr:radical SAM protein [Eubacteriales bacterium]
MLDKFVRNVRTLRLCVTDECNFRCHHCMAQTEKRFCESPLTDEECVELAHAAVRCGIDKLRLTGGEPLERPGIVSLCARLACVPGIRTVAMSTNGARLANFAGYLHKVGVTCVNVSLNTLSPHRFSVLTRGGVLHDTLAGLDTAIRLGFEQVKINVLLLGNVNMDEIVDFANLTRERPLEVRFVELMPLGVCADWKPERFARADEVLRLCPDLQPIEADGLAERYRLPGAIGTVGLIRTMSGCICDRCGHIRALADGTLKPCLHSAQEFPTRGLKGEALVRRIEECIRSRPEEYRLLKAPAQERRGMHQLGG